MTEKNVKVKMLKARVWNGSVWPIDSTPTVPESVAAQWVGEKAAVIVEQKANA